MTEAPRVRPLLFTDLDEAITALRERGLRLSTPRRLVLEALFLRPRARSRPSTSPHASALTPGRSTATSRRSRPTGSSSTSTSATGPGCTPWSARASASTRTATAAAPRGRCRPRSSMPSATRSGSCTASRPASPTSPSWGCVRAVRPTRGRGRQGLVSSGACGEGLAALILGFGVGLGVGLAARNDHGRAAATPPDRADGGSRLPPR
jgi:hypothetical protein